MREQNKRENADRETAPARTAESEAAGADDVSSARGWILGAAAVLVAVVVFLLITQAPKEPLPDWNRPVLGYEILTIFCVVIIALPALALLRIMLHRSRRKMMRGIRRLVLCAVAISISIVVLDIVLATFPALQSSFVDRSLLWNIGRLSSVDDPTLGYKGQPNLNATYIFDPVRDGILTPEVPAGKIEDSGEKRVTCTVRRDHNGFSNPDVPASADWLVVGDSFADEIITPGSKHWVTTLRENLTGGLYDIAAPGWGPDNEYGAMKEYGFPLKPRVVIWVFYEGNDIRDVGEFREFRTLARDNPDFTWSDYVARPPRHFPYDRPVMRLLLRIAELLNPGPTPADLFPGSVNPIRLTAGGKTVPHAIHLLEFQQLLMTRQHLTNELQDWKEADLILRKAMKSCSERRITFVLVYIPTKTRVYLPLIEEQVDRALFYNAVAPQISKELTSNPEKFLADVRRNESNVAGLMAEICHDERAIFIDTTDTLKKAALAGNFPYWSYDVHFNATGNDIAAKTILDRLRKEGLTP